MNFYVVLPEKVSIYNRLLKIITVFSLINRISKCNIILELLTGGSFGIEASVATVLFCLVISFIILKKAIINNQIIVPMWQRKKISATADLSQTA